MVWAAPNHKAPTSPCKSEAAKAADDAKGLCDALKQLQSDMRESANARGPGDLSCEHMKEEGKMGTCRSCVEGTEVKTCWRCGVEVISSIPTNDICIKESCREVSRRVEMRTLRGPWENMDQKKALRAKYRAIEIKVWKQLRGRSPAGQEDADYWRNHYEQGRA